MKKSLAPAGDISSEPAPDSVSVDEFTPGVYSVGVDAQSKCLTAEELAALFEIAPSHSISVGDPLFSGKRNHRGLRALITTITWDVPPIPEEPFEGRLRRTVELAHTLATTSQPRPHDTRLRVLLGVDEDIVSICLEPREMAVLTEAGVTFEILIIGSAAFGAALTDESRPVPVPAGRLED